MTAISYTVRPFSKTRTDLQDVFRLYLSTSALLSLKLKNGDICQLTTNTGMSKSAIVWTAQERIQDSVVQVSRVIQDLCSIKLGDKISITPGTGDMQIAERVELEPIASDAGTDTPLEEILGVDRPHWEWFLQSPLEKAVYLSIGMCFENVMLKGQRCSFKIQKIHCGTVHTTPEALFKFTKGNRVTIQSDQPTKELHHQVEHLELSLNGVGGMESQIRRINERLLDFSELLRQLILPPYYRKGGGILLYGPKGTGKTLLLQKVASAPWVTVSHINAEKLGRGTEIAKQMRDICQASILKQPALIVMDNLDTLAPKRTSADAGPSSGLTSALCDVFDRVADSRVLVIAAASHPNDIDDSLRTPSRFLQEIEMQIPNANDRTKILKILRGEEKYPSDDLLERLGERTHGYVGADLLALLKSAWRKARDAYFSKSFTGLAVQSNRCTPEEAEQTSTEVSSKAEPQSLVVSEEDIFAALQEIKPTAMREVFVETPKVRWSDIGGQHDIKRRLQAAVERPLKVRPSSLIEEMILIAVVS